MHLTLRWLNTGKDEREEEEGNVSSGETSICIDQRRVPHRKAKYVPLGLAGVHVEAVRVIGSAKEAIKRAEDVVFALAAVRGPATELCEAREAMAPDCGRLRWCLGACVGSRDLALQRGQKCGAAKR